MELPIPLSPMGTDLLLGGLGDRQRDALSTTNPWYRAPNPNSTPAAQPDLNSPQSTTNPFVDTRLQSSRALFESSDADKSFESGFNSATPSIDSRLLGSTPNFSRPSTPPPQGPPFSKPSLFLRKLRLQWLMYLLFLVGILGAAANRIFYICLEGTEAHNQFKIQYEGLVIAYITRASLVGSVIIAFQQQMWLRVRTKALPIGSVDKLFNANMDAMALFDRRLLLSAKAALFVAIIVWIAPVMTGVAPASLIVQQSLFVVNTTCPAIKTLDFTPEKTNDWRKTAKLSGGIKLPLSWWNATCDPFEPSNSDCFDYYTSPSSFLETVSKFAAYSKKPISRENAALDICGLGWNCSFTIDFTAPGYQCSEDVELSGFPFGKTILAPEGDTLYAVHATLGEYSGSQIDAGIGGIPVQKPPFPKGLGAFQHEPVIYAGHAVLKESVGKVPPIHDPNRAKAFEDPRLFKCEHQTVEYSVLFNYSSGVQTTTVLPNKKFLGLIQNTTLETDNGTVFAKPEENFVFPQDVENYRLFAAYHSLGVKFRYFINGSIAIDENEVPTITTDAGNSKLIRFDPYLPYPDLMERIQSLYEDMILSLLSNPDFIVVTNVTNTTQHDGLAGYPCTKLRYHNVYIYQKKRLLIAYAILIFLSAISVALGAVAQKKNGGHLKDYKFSSIVAATRGSKLDGLDWEVDGWGQVSEETQRTKIMYGNGARDGLGIESGPGEKFYKA